MHSAKPVLTFLLIVVLYTSGSGQNYYNRSLGIQFGYALPILSYKNGTYQDGNFNYATPGWALGAQLEVPIFKGLKYFIAARHTQNGFNEEQYASTAGETLRIQNSSQDYSVKASGGTYVNTQALIGLSYFQDISGNKKLFVIPKAGIGLLRSTHPKLNRDLYHASDLYNETVIFSNKSSLNVCISAGLQLKYYVSTRNTLTLDVDYTNSNIVTKNVKDREYFVPYHTVTYRYINIRIDYKIIHFLLGYSYNF